VEFAAGARARRHGHRAPALAEPDAATRPRPAAPMDNRPRCDGSRSRHQRRWSRASHASKAPAGKWAKREVSFGLWNR
jgi:hypothetical protein